MPPRGSTRGVPSSDSKGLVVTIIVLVIVILGLGVGTYLGFSEQGKLKAEVKKKEEEYQKANDERTWYMFQAGVLRSYLGFPPPDKLRIGRELAQHKSSFDSGSLGSKYEDYADFKDLAGKLATRMPWDGQKNQPTTNVGDLLRQCETKIQELQKQLAAALDESKQAKETLAEVRKQRKADQQKFETEVKDLGEKFNKKIAELEEQNKELEAKFNQAVNKKEPFVQKLADENVALKKQLAQLKRTSDKDRQAIDELRSRLDERRGAAALVKTSDDLRVHGRIDRVHLSQKRATINLGRADGLKVDTPFMVHGRLPNGKPKLFAKGKVRVISVGERQSEVEIVEMYDPNDQTEPRTNLLEERDRKTGRLLRLSERLITDPIIRGDLLVNSGWDPRGKKHVAIAGRVELYQDHEIPVADFVRHLEKNGYIVDAYVNPADGTLQGSVSRRTDMLILGGSFTPGDRRGPADAEVVKQFNKNREKVVGDAKENAVPFITPRRFLQETGIDLPGGR